MQFEKVHLIYFSPNGSTRRTLRNIARGLSIGSVVDHDLTLPAKRSLELLVPESDLVIFGMPVYGGRLPSPFHDGLPVVGSGAAVSVVVYGNRYYDDALIELVNLTAEAGFHTLAAGAFVAEHALNSRIATGRPDTDDVRRQIVFGEEIMRKSETLESTADLSRLPVTGNIPYRKFRKMPIVPVLQVKRCTACGTCVSGCPMQIISADTFRLNDPDRCILCFRCVNRCPGQARRFPFLKNVLFQKKIGELEKACRVRKEPEYFI